ncbi:ABC transporter permease [Halobacillus litoralis]|uniref:ABC transporter permease n=1 Tax=Halobacillus litoralis TaxID=45668 RepID=UPI001CFCDDEC|nr:FtsX-like permease family protein [Halobacillus litoralis]
MTLKKSIFRTLKENKFQYAGVIVLLVLAVMLYISLSMAITTLEERNKHFASDYKQESFHFITGKKLSYDQLSAWEDKFDITLEQRTYKDLSLDETTLRLFSKTEQVNIPYVAEGTVPEEEGEIAISRVYAERNGYHVGDKIDIGSLKAEVTGFVYLPDYIYMVSQLTDLLSDAEKFGIGIASEETLQQLKTSGQSQILGWSKNDVLPKGLREVVESETTLLQYVEAGDNPRIQFVESEIDGAKTMTTTLPLFILALSITMVLMLMKRRLDMQRKEIGTLMALGYRKGELLRHYLGYAWIIGLTGTIVGILAGAGLSIPLSNIYANYFNLPALSMFEFEPFVLVIGLVIPLSLLILLTALVINQSLKAEPLTLLRPKEMAGGKKSWLENLPLMNRGGFIHRYRLRLLVRSKTRSLYIFLGVMFSTILLLFGFITFNSMDQVVEKTYEDILTYEYGVYYKSLKTEKVAGEASPFIMNEIKVKGEDTKITAYGMEKDTPYIQLLSDGKPLNTKLSEGAVLSAPLAAVLGVEGGEELTLEIGNDDTITVKVAGVSDLYIGNTIYLPRSQLNDFLNYPQDAYTGVWQTEEPVESDDIYRIEDKQKAMESFESTSGATRASVLGMSVFAVIIGLIVLTLLTNLIVEENSPSISLFKVMGYYDSEVSKLVLNVYTPIVFLSYFVSIPIAGLSLEQTMNSVVEETGFILPTDVSWWMVLLGFVVIMLTYWLSLTLSKRKLKQVSLQDALKKQQD